MSDADRQASEGASTRSLRGLAKSLDYVATGVLIPTRFFYLYVWLPGRRRIAVPVGNWLARVMRWLFRQSARGPLFAPAPITSLALFFASVWLAFYVYVGLVQTAYRNLFVAYEEANVFRDILAEDPTIQFDGREDQQAVLFRTLQLLGRKSQDDIPDSLETPNDDDFGIHKALVAGPGAKDVPLLDTPTVRVIAQLARSATDSETSTADKSPQQPIGRSAPALAAVLAGQPTAAETLNRLWSADSRNLTAEQFTEALQRLGNNLVLPGDPRLILWPIERVPVKTSRESPTTITPQFNWRLKRDVAVSLFPPEQVTDAHAVSLLYRQMGVDGKFNRLRKQGQTPATDENVRHFLRLESFLFALVARLHANTEVKQARQFITLVQGPEQLGLLVGFFWMVLLLLARFLKRTLVGIQFGLVRRRVYDTLAEIGADDAEASLQKRRKALSELSRRIGSRANNDGEFFRRMKDRLVEWRTGVARDNPTRWQAFRAKLTWTLGWLAQVTLSAVEVLTRVPLRLPTLEYAEQRLWQWATSTPEGELTRTERALRMAGSVVTIVIILPVLLALHRAYILLAWLWWHGPLAMIRAGRAAIIRLLEICMNELSEKSPSPDVLRHSCRYLRERDRSSRWIIRWIARALPAIGFIGTVRGISAALSGADTIVRAQTPTEQAAAITSVAGTLGIAFTTTLIALLFGLITSYFDDLQSVQESDLVRDVEETLIPLLEPSLFTRSSTPGNAAS